MRTALSFLRTVKYPPSLLFLLAALGARPAAPPAPSTAARPRCCASLVFGRVPLFYYVMHMPLIHLVAVGVCLARYGTAHWMFESPRPDLIPFTPPPGWGFDLPVVYLVWLAVSWRSTRSAAGSRLVKRQRQPPG